MTWLLFNSHNGKLMRQLNQSPLHYVHILSNTTNQMTEAEIYFQPIGF